MTAPLKTVEGTTDTAGLMHDIGRDEDRVRLAIGLHHGSLGEEASAEEHDGRGTDSEPCHRTHTTTPGATGRDLVVAHRHRERRGQRPSGEDPGCRPERDRERAADDRERDRRSSQRHVLRQHEQPQDEPEAPPVRSADGLSCRHRLRHRRLHPGTL